MFDGDFSNLYTKEALIFYKENHDVPISKLLFKYGSNPLYRNLCLQLESRRKIKNKLPSWLDQHQIVFPPKLNLEQASSEATASYKADLVDFKSSLDLTGGTGIDSWQFALLGKKHVYVEPNESLLKITQHNFSILNIENTKFYCGTAEQYLEQCGHFDLIYIDPSRRNTSGSKVIKLEEYSPNVIDLLPKLLEKGSKLLVKVSPFADLSYLIKLFSKNLVELHVVAVHNECKEILLLLNSQINSSVKVKAANIGKSRSEKFSFEWNSNAEPAQYADDISNYIFEPNVAVLKSGAFNQISHQFLISKLEASSHLYTAGELVPRFPGKTYRVLEVAPAYKLKGSYLSASIVSRNFPDKPDVIRKRMKIQEGSDYRIFATTFKRKKVFIVGKVLIDKPD